jgi:hypothetical protein
MPTWLSLRSFTQFVSGHVHLKDFGQLVAGEVVSAGGVAKEFNTRYLKSKGLGKSCELITDGRFSGGSSGLSIGHVSPEPAEGGLISLVDTGDTITMDIPNRRIQLDVADDTLASRRAAMDANGTNAWNPQNRLRKVSQALRAYATLTTNASRGAVRDVTSDAVAAPAAGRDGGAPGRIRTYDTRLRRPVLYPAELRAPSRRAIVEEDAALFIPIRSKSRPGASVDIGWRIARAAHFCRQRTRCVPIDYRQFLGQRNRSAIIIGLLLKPC